MKIGFYGDSFCCEESNPHSIAKGYNTYIKMLKQKHNANIVHLGHGGSSVWDVIIKQFDVDNAPDVCIFCWTDYARLYNNRLRNLTKGSVENKAWKDYSLNDLIYRNTINAAKGYFKYLHDEEKAKIEHIAALQYFDLNVLPQITSKIIHMWSFDEVYEWKHGSVIKTPLYSLVDSNATGFDTWAANHINGEDNNTEVLKLIEEYL